MSTRKLRVGVIGVGRMGERHCRIYSGLNSVRFVGVSDASPERGGEVARKYGVRTFADHRDLLDRVDAVSVVTPTPAHFAMVRECLQRRIHVLVEKPIALTVAEGRELVRLAHQSSSILQVGHIERFNPAFAELQGILEELQIVAVNARRLSPFAASNTDVDVVFDLMIHDIDLALALIGSRIDSIQAHGRSVQTTAADFAVASLATADGPLAMLTASRVTEQKVRLLEITALGAYVEVDLLNKSLCVYRGTFPEYMANQQRPLRYRQESFVERIHIPTAEPLQLELQEFARCAIEGSRPTVSGEEGLLALEVATAIREQLLSSCIRPATLLAAS